MNLQNGREVHRLLHQVKPRGIFHLAAQSVPRFSWANPAQTFVTNAVGTLNLLEAMRQGGWPCRFIFASTSQVYGRCFYRGISLNEVSLVWPESPYAASKFLAELSILNYVSKFNLDAVIARPTNHIGPGQRSDFVFSDWCRQIATAEAGHAKNVLEVGNLNLRRDFLDVSDVVKAYGLLFSKGKTGEIYNIASGQCHPLRKYADFLITQARRPMKLKVMSQRVRENEYEDTLLNSNAIKKLGWKVSSSPFTALKQMLAEWRNKVS